MKQKSHVLKEKGRQGRGASGFKLKAIGGSRHKVELFACFNTNIRVAFSSFLSCSTVVDFVRPNPRLRQNVFLLVNTKGLPDVRGDGEARQRRTYGRLVDFGARGVLLTESAEPVHCVHAGRNSWPGWFLGFSESSVRLSPKDVWLMGNLVDAF